MPLVRLPYAWGAACACLLAACSRPADQPAPPAEAPAEPIVMEVGASDFAFAAPDTVRAGLVTIRMSAAPGAFHHAQVVRLDDGHTLAEAAAAMAAHAPAPWMHFVGGVNGADPGKAAETQVPLAPGQYALLCLIPSEDGMPHMAKGMMKAFTVAGDAAPVAAPAADARLVFGDTAYALTGTIAAGRRTILVESASDVPHEVIMVKLADGATGQALVDWLLAGAKGPPPGSGVGGTVAMERGGWNVVHADFTPGRYAFVDFMPHPADRRPNAAHGMMLELEVR